MGKKAKIKYMNSPEMVKLAEEMFILVKTKTKSYGESIMVANMLATMVSHNALSGIQSPQAVKQAATEAFKIVKSKESENMRYIG